MGRGSRSGRIGDNVRIGLGKPFTWDRTGCNAEMGLAIRREIGGDRGYCWDRFGNRFEVRHEWKTCWDRFEGKTEVRHEWKTCWDRFEGRTEGRQDWKMCWDRFEGRTEVRQDWFGKWLR